MMRLLRSFFFAFTCEHYTELSSRRLDGDLSLFEKAKFSLHHVICTFCRRSTRQFVLIEKAAKRVAEDTPHVGGEPMGLSDEAKRKLEQIVK